ncbi:quinone oxidoreductase-like protein 1 isoform X2 [Boleophthalmus pectinirostris]|uniref:quinone oxidoreductase-like protein 1 isoform X2 n=1 Tax=Boleophthalmus pectinirostris TaxID=150288 RepID=UPI00242FA87B|nr:quinone oxidoreductase-like protein 1 isoform X2 [Boleophthalmus pectinirostris]
MKGLYCRATGRDGELQFMIQETRLPEVLSSHQVRVEVKLLREMKIERDLISVGREVVGVVKQVGSKVSLFQPDEEVVGILPLDCPFSGLCGVIDIDEHYLVHKPVQLSRVTVAAALRDAVAAYTALHTLAHMADRHSVLVVDGANSFGLMCIQLAWYHGLKVLTTSHSSQDHTFLEQLRPTVGVQDPIVARVIPVYKGQISNLVPAVLEETGDLGVDIVIDSGVHLHKEEEEADFVPHKHDLIDVLAVGGHWVTSHPHLQLDPPDCSYLHLKSASVSFLNPEVWTASSAQHGRYLHILKDIVDKMSTGVLRPQPEEALPLYEATVAMENIQHHPKRKAVVKLTAED